jgi:hypothetical protein
MSLSCVLIVEGHGHSLAARGCALGSVWRTRDQCGLLEPAAGLAVIKGIRDRSPLRRPEPALR